MREYKPKNCNEQLLRKLIKNSINYIQVLKGLNLRPGGNNYSVLKNWIKYFNIDISHFETSQERGRRVAKFAGTKAIPLEQILTKNSTYNCNNLKKRLYKEGIKNRKCELCTQGEEWNGMNISLILDHIDGDHLNNELINLRIVCPNCNAGLDTHCSKNRVKNNLSYYEKRKAKNKNIVINNRQEYLDKLREKGIENNNERIERIKKLNIDFSTTGWGVRLGKELNKSPQYIRKWIQQYMPEIWENAFKHK